MTDEYQRDTNTFISTISDDKLPQHAKSETISSSLVDAPSASATEMPKAQSGLRSFVSYVVLLAVAFVIFLFLRTFVFIPYDIPSGSMEDTIMPGDMVFSEKISYYLREPAQGDIVTFADPLVAGRTLIKRVIATEGQSVDFLDGQVVIDGVVQDEPYTLGKATLPFDQTAPSVQISYPYTVPAGHIWVMGDNRPFSQDSRYFGAVEVDTVTGRAAMIYWPFSDFRIF